ncbi:MAG: hypothetical protein DRO43_01740 [Candidatus Hecatellales archaeon]|nr:MAG: hypothetical protein DRO43_01740 [Candidatus Hecatellales archaeon]
MEEGLKSDRREYPSFPKVGVGGLVIDKDKLLLIKRAYEPSSGLWSIPGGLLEVGEELEEAVAREIEEETGIKVEVKELLGVFNFVIRDEAGKVKYHYVLIDFLAKPVGGKLRPSRETLDARWVSLKDIEKYSLTRTTRRLISRAVERGLIRED